MLVNDQTLLASFFPDRRVAAIKIEGAACLKFCGNVKGDCGPSHGSAPSDRIGRSDARCGSATRFELSSLSRICAICSPLPRPFSSVFG